MKSCVAAYAACAGGCDPDRLGRVRHRSQMRRLSELEESGIARDLDVAQRR
jgi:hypothetical protein